MWFNNALFYQYQLPETKDFTEGLRQEALKTCPPHARFTYGWLPAMGDELAQQVAGSALIALGKEERILPRAVITRMLAEKIQHIEMAEGRTVKRSEKAQMAEDLEFELLPKAFIIQKRMPAILDSMSQHIIINSASANQASQLLSLLRKSLPDISIEPLSPDSNLNFHFSQWLTEPSSLPSQFQLASDCMLISPANERKKVNCKGYELPADEINTLLEQGMQVTEISLIWQERIQFTLTQDFIFKRIKCLDYLQDDFNDLRQLEEEFQQQDAALTLLTGELRALVNDSLKAVQTETTKDLQAV
jgi:recombination associated protein RdgC